MLPFGRALSAALAICSLTAFSASPARAVMWPAAAFSSPSAPIVVAVIGNPADIAIRLISGRVPFAVNRTDVQRRGLKLSSKRIRLASSFE